MSLYNFKQLLDKGAQSAGIKDVNNLYQFSDDTFPTIEMAKGLLNDSIREETSMENMTCLQTSKSMNFWHVIEDVQSLDLFTYSGSVIVSSGSIIPYPSSVLSLTQTSENSVQDIVTNFSGISYTTTSGTTTVSTSGIVAYHAYTGVGYPYQMPSDLNKFMQGTPIVIAQSTPPTTANGIIVKNVDFADIWSMIPIGLVQSSGTPYYFAEAPGMDYLNNKVIQFFPFPILAFSGSQFVVNYYKKHVDLVEDTDTQNVIPESWQQLIIQAFLVKIYEITEEAGSPRLAGAIRTREELRRKFRMWDFNQPSKIRKWKDARTGIGSNSAYDTSTYFYLNDSDQR